MLPQTLAFIGFGEAAMAFLSGWGGARPATVFAYDIKIGDPRTHDAMQARYKSHGVRAVMSAEQAVENAEVVVSVVTADQALHAVEAAVPGLAKGVLWLDCNSCAPGTKQRAAQVIEGAGGRYADVAVMSPVQTRRHHVPLLVSGPHAQAAEAVLQSLDMRPAIAGDTVGQASSIKMMRSVMIKGMEALVAECLLSARRAGVEEAVIASLEASDPDIAWRSRATYNLDRMMVHGARRAAEMQEVAATVEELGLPNAMSRATATWEAEVAKLGLDPGADDLSARLDRILSAL